MNFLFAREVGIKPLNQKNIFFCYALFCQYSTAKFNQTNELKKSTYAFCIFFLFYQAPVCGGYYINNIIQIIMVFT